MSTLFNFDLDDILEDTDGDFGEVVATPTGDEIVMPGWDDEPTVVRQVPHSILIQCVPHSTIEMKKAG